MAGIRQKRTGQFMRFIFKLLMDKPNGLLLKDIRSKTSKAIPLTKYEIDYYPSTPNFTRFEKFISFAAIAPVKAGWLVKSKGRWFITAEGRQAYSKFKNPEEFYKEAKRLYRQWSKEKRKFSTK